MLTSVEMEGLVVEIPMPELARARMEVLEMLVHSSPRRNPGGYNVIGGSPTSIVLVVAVAAVLERPRFFISTQIR
jgi:hypothetical protein